MAQAAWADAGASAFTLCDGDTEESASLSGTDSVDAIAESLLRRGVSPTIVAEAFRGRVDERRLREMLLEAKGGGGLGCLPAAEAVDAADAVDAAAAAWDVAELFKYPEEYCCKRTGALISRPVVGADGYTYEAASCPAGMLSKTLLHKLDGFKSGRVRQIMEAAQRAGRAGSSAIAAEILEGAAGLIRAEPQHAALFKEVLELQLCFPSDSQLHRRELVALLPNDELISRAEEMFDPPEGPPLAAEQVLSPRRAETLLSSSQAAHPRVTHLLGMAFLAKCDEVIDATNSPLVSCAAASEIAFRPSVATWCQTLIDEKRDVRQMRRPYLLARLYSSAPTPELRAKLADAVIFDVPFADLHTVLIGLPKEVVFAAADRTAHVGRVAAEGRRAAAILVAAARQAEPADAEEMYRRAVSEDPGCADGRAGLVASVLRGAGAGVAGQAASAEVWRILLEDRAVQTIADNFGFLGGPPSWSVVDAAFTYELAKALAKKGQMERAAEIAVIAGMKLEESAADGAALNDALTRFEQALRWDRCNEPAATAMQRLPPALGAQGQVAAKLLTPLARDAVDERLLAGAMGMWQANMGAMARHIEDQIGKLSRAVALKEDKPHLKLTGFERVTVVNGTYYCDRSILVSGKPTYWTVERNAFVYGDEIGTWYVTTCVSGEKYDAITAGRETCALARTKQTGTFDPCAADVEWDEFDGTTGWVAASKAARALRLIEDQVGKLGNKIAEVSLDVGAVTKTVALKEDKPHLKITGFERATVVNGQYYCDRSVVVGDRPTYWTVERNAFLYCGGEECRWYVTTDVSGEKYDAITAGRQTWGRLRTKQTGLSDPSAEGVEWDEIDEMGRWVAAAARARRLIEDQVGKLGDTIAEVRLEVKALSEAVAVKEDKPRLELTGSRSQTNNGTYIRDTSIVVAGEPTYWTVGRNVFLYRGKNGQWYVTNTVSGEKYDAITAGRSSLSVLRTKQTGLSDPSAEGVEWEEFVDNEWVTAAEAKIAWIRQPSPSPARAA